MVDTCCISCFGKESPHSGVLYQSPLIMLIRITVNVQLRLMVTAKLL